MKRTATLLFIFIFPQLWGQNKKADSLWTVFKNKTQADTSRLKAIDAIAWSYRFNKPDTGVILAHQELELAQKSKQRNYEAKAMYTLSTAFRAKGDYTTAMDWCQKSLAVFQETNNRMGIGNCFNNIGNIYLKESEFTKALEYNLKALKVKEGIGDKEGMANCYGNIGNIYSILFNYPLALDYEQKALKIMEDLGNKRGMGNCYSSMGIVFKEQANYPKALEFYLKDLEINKATNNIAGERLCYGNMAVIYQIQSDYRKALDYHLLGLQLCRKTGDKQGIGVCYSNMSDLYNRLKDYKQAIFYGDSALMIGKQIGDISIERTANQAISTAYEKTAHYKEALAHYVTFKELTDSTFNIENSRQLGDLKTKFEVDKKEVELKAKAEAEKDKLKAIAAEEGKRQHLITYSVAGGFILVLVFSIVIFNRLQITRRQKTTIEKQKSMVEEQKLEVELQKHKVEEHRKEIIDSITYAKRLQLAILPNNENVKKHFPESFVYYRPKDIVAGDFYWMEHLDGITYIAAADSTGHGVPGAMVSIVCSNALNRAVKEFKLRETGKILDMTRELVLETFAKSTSDVKDGMDISFLAIPDNKQEAYWSGANNPLWYIAEGQLTEIKANKQSIGKTDNPASFTTHRIRTSKGLIFYLFTDGFADQFGGTKGKKFKYKQLEDLLLKNCGASLEMQHEILSGTFESWKGSLEQVDDVTIIGIRIS